MVFCLFLYHFCDLPDQVFFSTPIRLLTMKSHPVSWHTTALRLCFILGVHRIWDGFLFVSCHFCDLPDQVFFSTPIRLLTMKSHPVSWHTTALRLCFILGVHRIWDGFLFVSCHFCDLPDQVFFSTPIRLLTMKSHPVSWHTTALRLCFILRVHRIWDGFLFVSCHFCDLPDQVFFSTPIRLLTMKSHPLSWHTTALRLCFILRVHRIWDGFLFVSCHFCDLPDQVFFSTPIRLLTMKSHPVSWHTTALRLCFILRVCRIWDSFLFVSYHFCDLPDQVFFSTPIRLLTMKSHPVSWHTTALRLCFILRVCRIWDSFLFVSYHFCDLPDQVFFSTPIRLLTMKSHPVSWHTTAFMLCFILRVHRIWDGFLFVSYHFCDLPDQVFFSTPIRLLTMKSHPLSWHTTAFMLCFILRVHRIWDGFLFVSYHFCDLPDQVFFSTPIQLLTMKSHTVSWHTTALRQCFILGVHRIWDGFLFVSYHFCDLPDQVFFSTPIQLLTMKSHPVSWHTTALRLCFILGVHRIWDGFLFVSYHFCDLPDQVFFSTPIRLLTMKSHPVSWHTTALRLCFILRVHRIWDGFLFVSYHFCDLPDQVFFSTPIQLLTMKSHPVSWHTTALRLCFILRVHRIWDGFLFVSYHFCDLPDQVFFSTPIQLLTMKSHTVSWHTTAFMLCFILRVHRIWDGFLFVSYHFCDLPDQVFFSTPIRLLTMKSHPVSWHTTALRLCFILRVHRIWDGFLFVSYHFCDLPDHVFFSTPIRLLTMKSHPLSWHTTALRLCFILRVCRIWDGFPFVSYHFCDLPDHVFFSTPIRLLTIKSHPASCHTTALRLCFILRVHRIWDGFLFVSYHFCDLPDQVFFSTPIRLLPIKPHPLSWHTIVSRLCFILRVCWIWDAVFCLFHIIFVTYLTKSSFPLPFGCSQWNHIQWVGIQQHSCYASVWEWTQCARSWLILWSLSILSASAGFLSENLKRKNIHKLLWLWCAPFQPNFEIHTNPDFHSSAYGPCHSTIWVRVLISRVQEELKYLEKS